MQCVLHCINRNMAMPAVSKQITLPKAKKVNEIIKLLENEYGVQEPEQFREEDPSELLVLTILSQNTNDVNRDRAYESLRAKFPTWEAVARARPNAIKSAIRVGGLAEQKSRRIIAALKWIKGRFGEYSLEALRELPSEEVYEMLTSLDGVGPKTASIVLLFSLGRPYFPVDTHIHRVTTRLGLVPEKADAVKAHDILGKAFPKEKYFSAHLNIIAHGRKICVARKPKCSKCVLIKLCPWPVKHPKEHV